MFIGGIVFLMAGAVLGYGSKWILRKFDRNEAESLPILFILKLMGFILVIAGFLMVVNGEFPEGLKFIRMM